MKLEFVEKKNTLPILSNVLLQLKDNKLSIIATDLDIIFYDAFGYNAQPELWEPHLMRKCFELLNPGGVWVSYCAKGSVRRGLKKAGFKVFRLPGPPGKREMLRAVKE